MEKLLIVSGIVIIIFGASIVIAGTQHKHNEGCKWIAPLQVQYVMCSDGKVRLK